MASGDRFFLEEEEEDEDEDEDVENEPLDELLKTETEATGDVHVSPFANDDETF